MTDGAAPRARMKGARARRSTMLAAAASVAVAAAVLLIATRSDAPGGGAREPRASVSRAGAEPAAAADALVTVGSPSSRYPESRQGEPSVAIDPSSPNVVAAGANDTIDVAPCDAGSHEPCRGGAGVGLSGVYLSFDGGRTWRQPEYRGWSGRSGTARRGPIGTLPRYREAGLVSRGAQSAGRS